MYLATTGVHEYPKDRIKEGFTRENCYAIIKWCYADADCNADELIEYITEFRSNPHQFAETYGY